LPVTRPQSGRLQSMHLKHSLSASAIWQLSRGVIRLGN
jgi:hypothetical protein